MHAVKPASDHGANSAPEIVRLGFMDMAVVINAIVVYKKYVTKEKGALRQVSTCIYSMYFSPLILQFQKIKVYHKSLFWRAPAFVYLRAILCNFELKNLVLKWCILAVQIFVYPLFGM